MPLAGVHYVKGGWPSDGVLDPLEPEFLMYAPSAGGPQLVAVEYAVLSKFGGNAFGVPMHYAGELLKAPGVKRPAP